jgi:uncharacterized Tic20 family protein
MKRKQQAKRPLNFSISYVLILLCLAVRIPLQLLAVTVENSFRHHLSSKYPS